MKAYSSFLKKELMENVRTYKLWIMLGLFLILGVISPVGAKILPDLLEATMPPEMNINIAVPTAFDSWAQFFKNVSQLGMIVFVIMFGGLIAKEISKGTLVNLLAKGLSRTTVILAKLTSAVIVWTISVGACFGVCYLLTEYFWSTSEIKELIFSVICAYIFGILLIASVLLGGMITKKGYGAMLFTGALAVAMSLLSIFPDVQKYNPIRLVSDNVSILTGACTVSELLPSLGITAALSVIFVIVSVLLFKKTSV